MKTIGISPLLLIAATGTGTALANEAVGYVKTVSGEASVITAANAVKAQVGSSVFQGSRIRTAKNASIGVTFKDNTVMSIGPDTELTIDEYIFNPNQGQLKFGSNIAKGTLNYVSGTIAKLKPEAVTVTTPSGIIGVRGTHFVAKVEDAE